MEDFEMGMDKGESAGIRFYQGKKPARIYLWHESDNRFSIAIEIEGEEKHVVEISNGCSKITTTKIDGVKTHK